MALIIIVAIYVIGLIIAGIKISKWEHNTKFEKVWFTILWPVIPPLYACHWIYNHWIKNM